MVDKTKSGVYYVIYDQLNEGWARLDPIEGWHFTMLEFAATQFATKAEALATIYQHYGQSKTRLAIVEKQHP